MWAEGGMAMLRVFSCLFALFAFVSLPSFYSSSAFADSTLLGVWKLNGFVVESVETKLRRYPFGQNPKGYVVITADRLITVLTGEGRKPPTTDDDRASSFKTMIAYSGQYRIEDNRLTTKVDAAWNEGWTGTDQVRIFRLEGDRLFIETLPAPSVTAPELGIVRGILEFERTK
jgi:hypothetical protein